MNRGHLKLTFIVRRRARGIDAAPDDVLVLWTPSRTLYRGRRVGTTPNGRSLSVIRCRRWALRAGVQSGALEPVDPIDSGAIDAAWNEWPRRRDSA